MTYRLRTGFDRNTRKASPVVLILADGFMVVAGFYTVAQMMAAMKAAS